MANAAPKIERPFDIVCDTDDEKEWLSHRHTGLGTSEIGAIIGSDHRSSPVKLFYEKLGIIEPDDLSDVEAVQWGHTLEPVIAREFAERTGRKVTTGRKHRFQTLRSREHQWAMASLDFWTGEGSELWPLEVKNVTAWKAEDWANGAPEYFLAQLQQQLLVTGAERCTSACLRGGNRLLWCDVERDETMIRKIIFHGAIFWQRIVQGEPPEPDGSEATKAVLAKLYPSDDGSIVKLPAALESIVYQWRELKERTKGDEKQIALLEAQIKSTLGAAQRGIFPGGDSVSWASQARKAYTVQPGTYRVLRFHERK